MLKDYFFSENDNFRIGPRRHTVIAEGAFCHDFYNDSTSWMNDVVDIARDEFAKVNVLRSRGKTQEIKVLDDNTLASCWAGKPHKFSRLISLNEGFQIPSASIREDRHDKGNFPKNLLLPVKEYIRLGEIMRCYDLKMSVKLLVTDSSLSCAEFTAKLNEDQFRCVIPFSLEKKGKLVECFRPMTEGDLLIS